MPNSPNHSPSPAISSLWFPTKSTKFASPSLLIFTAAVLYLLTLFPLQICSAEKIHEMGPSPWEMNAAEVNKTSFQPMSAAPVMTTPRLAEEGMRSSRAKRQHHPHDNTGFSVRSLIELVFCFFLPPAAVALHGGPSFKLHILLNVVLCVLGWVPGILHAIWYCFMSGF